VRKGKRGLIGGEISWSKDDPRNYTNKNSKKEGVKPRAVKGGGKKRRLQKKISHSLKKRPLSPLP